MKNNKNKLLLAGIGVLLVISVTFVGCVKDLFDDGKTFYNGPSQIEFFPLSDEYSLRAGEVKSYDITINLISKQLDQPVKVEYEIVDELTTAENGIQFKLTAQSVEIPANSSSAKLPVEISGEGLGVGESVQLALRLKSNDVVKAAPNLSVYIVTIQGRS